MLLVSRALRPENVGAVAAAVQRFARGGAVMPPGSVAWVTPEEHEGLLVERLRMALERKAAASSPPQRG